MKKQIIDEKMIITKEYQTFIEDIKNRYFHHQKLQLLVGENIK